MTGNARNKHGFKRYLTPRALTWAMVSVVVLALVIFGVAALSATDEDPTSAVDPALDRITSLNALASAALESGETTAAQEYLARSTALDPANAETRRLVQQLQQKTNTPESTTPPTNDTTHPPDDPEPPASDADYLKAYDNVKVLLPTKAATGFALGVPDGDSFSAAVLCLPTSAQGVERVTLTVFDQKDPAKAKAFVDSIGKAYPLTPANVTVGSLKGKYGTDSGGLGSVAFARGRFSFEVIVIGSGASADSLKRLAVSLAESFPAAR
ncbi:MAG: hypothetical protein Q8K99_03435 [Actinomycetota bacterium]|nr:hypothetical protein [Actinomycetota bacterium]